MNKCFSVCFMSLVKFQSAEMIVFDCLVQLYSCFWKGGFFFFTFLFCHGGNCKLSTLSFNDKIFIEDELSIPFECEYKGSVPVPKIMHCI